MAARQERTTTHGHEPDLDVEHFHAATDSMARVVQRVRGEDPAPAPRPRRRARKARVGFHPSARSKDATSVRWHSPGEQVALRRAERRTGDGRPVLLVVAVAILVLGAVALAAAPDDGDQPDEVTASEQGGGDGGGDGEGGGDGGKTTSTTEATTTTAPPDVAVQSTPGVVTVTAPKAKISVEATALCWMRVTLDGTESSDVVLDPGERETFEAMATIEMRIGNPGGVVLQTAGSPIDLGDQSGQPVDLTLSTTG